jgi:hypothetical protein
LKLQGDDEHVEEIKIEAAKFKPYTACWLSTA